MSNNVFTFFRGIVCDDVRREISGKDILIGVYQGAILVPRFPVNLLLSLWVPLQCNKPGSYPLQFRVVGPHEVQYVSGVIPTIFQTKESGSVTVAGAPVPIQLAGEIDFQLLEPGGEWQSVRKMPVRVPTQEDMLYGQLSVNPPPS
jgi:hypothetical protein